MSFDVVLIDNGAIQMKVLAKSGNKVDCEVLTEGKLGSRRHINLPGVKVSLPALTAKDIQDVKLGSQIYALCARDDVAAALTLSYSVTPFVVPFDLINQENTIGAALKLMTDRGRLAPGNTAVIIGSILVGEHMVDAVQMRVV